MNTEGKDEYGNRRKEDRRLRDRRQDKLGPALDEIEAGDVKNALAVADARIEIRCPAEMKSEMECIAARYGLTLTAYLLRLHKLAATRLQEE